MQPIDAAPPGFYEVNIRHLDRDEAVPPLPVSAHYMGWNDP